MDGEIECESCTRPAQGELCEDCLSECRTRGIVDILGATIVTGTIIFGGLNYEFNTLVIALLALLAALLAQDGVKHYRAYRTHRS